MRIERYNKIRLFVIGGNKWVNHAIPLPIESVSVLLKAVIIEPKPGNKFAIIALTGARTILIIVLMIPKKTLKIIFAINYHPHVFHYKHVGVHKLNKNHRVKK